jgi:hypothetical protein
MVCKLYFKKVIIYGNNNNKIKGVSNRQPRLQERHIVQVVVMEADHGQMSFARDKIGKFLLFGLGVGGREGIGKGKNYLLSNIILRKKQNRCL